MSIYARLGGYVGLEPNTTSVYHNRDGGGLWEELRITQRGPEGWFNLDFVAAKKPLRLNQQHQLVTGADHDGWGGQWVISADGKTATCDGVRLELEGYVVAKPIHLEQRGNDFVDASGNRVVYVAVDGFDDLWFATQGRAAELDALMKESVQLEFKMRRIWCMGDAGENQVFSLYPQNTPHYIDTARSLVAYENGFGQVPLFTACVDAQKVMPNRDQLLGFWRDLNDGLRGSGVYAMSVVNQHTKNLPSGVRPSDFANPGSGVIWSRGSDVDDTITSPDGNGGKASASELHATRNSFDRALMDSTASPPFMRAHGAGMVWMTEGNPFGDSNGYSEEQAWQLGRGYSILWALACFHNRQSQRGQLMTEETARCAAAWVKGMAL